jgi:hypothetical protein
MNSFATPRTTASLPRWRLFADRSARRALALVMAAATAVISPMLFLGNASGHDFGFHIASWMETARQWHEGVIYPRWAAWANYGFGEPRFIFYPPASWLLGAALGTVLPWRAAPGVLIWLTLVASGLSMFALSREWLSPSAAIAASVFYAVNPYHLVIVYYRSDFAELIASAVFPLVILFALRVGRTGWNGIVPLAVVFGAVWLSNAPAAVIITYSLTLVLVVESIVHRSARPAAAGALAMATGFGLAAFYIVPATWEQRWVNISQVISDNLRAEQNFLFTRANDPEFVLFNWKVSGVALGVILVAGVVAVVTARQRRSMPGAWWAAMGLAAVSAALMFPASGLAWKYLPKLRFVQFPWRWLVPLNLACWFLFAAATAGSRKRWAWWTAMAAAFAILGTAIVRDAWWDSEDVRVALEAISSDRGYEGNDEYAPLGCDNYDLPKDAPRIAAPKGMRARIERWSPERRILTVDSARPGNLALKLVNYPAWEVEVNGENIKAISKPGTAQMLLPLPAGSSRVQVKFARTPDRTVGDVISTATVALLAGLMLFERRRKARPPIGRVS